MAKKAEAIVERAAGGRPIVAAGLVVLAAAAAIVAMIAGLDPLFAAYGMGG